MSKKAAPKQLPPVPKPPPPMEPRKPHEFDEDEPNIQPHAFRTEVQFVVERDIGSYSLHASASDLGTLLRQALKHKLFSRTELERALEEVRDLL